MKKNASFWQEKSELPAWFALPTPKICHGKIAVIGGGLAGLSCAYALIKRGYQVDIFEAENVPAGKASSNQQALLKPHLSPNFNLADQFYTGGFFYSRHIIQELQQVGIDFEYDLNGLLHLAATDSLHERFAKIHNKRQLPSDFAQFVDNQSASILAGTALHSGGMYFPTAGTVNLAALCQALIKACGAKLGLHTGQAINRLNRHDSEWLLYNDQNQLAGQADSVVIANAAAARELSECRDYPISPLPGQISLVAATPESTEVKIPLSYEGYLTPAKNGMHSVGSSYRHGREQDVTENSRDHCLVESYLQKTAPELNLDFSKAKAWVQARSVSPDHLPLVGAVAVKTEFMQVYQKLSQGNARFSFPQAEYLPNLYLSVGHGSKGLTSTLLSGEILACLIDGHALPISAKVYQAIHPSRFWLRELKQGHVQRNRS